MPPATARTCGITSSAERTPTKTIVVITTRRTSGSASPPPAPARAGSAPCRRASRGRASPPRRAPRSRNRCQLCMGGVLFGIERACVLRTLLPARASVATCVFAEPPAEQHLLAVEARREVDRPVSRSLTIAPRSWTAFTRWAISTRSRRSASSSSASAPRVDAAAVAGDAVRPAPRAPPAVAAARGDARPAPRRAGGSRGAPRSPPSGVKRRAMSPL